MNENRFFESESEGADAVRALPSVSRCLAFSMAALRDAGVDTPRLDSQLMLARVLGCRRENLAARPEKRLTEDEASCFLEFLAERKKRRPLAYILGSQWFYGLEFDIDESVLIPRPETELLVEFALGSAPENGSAADIATGSGCIAIGISANRPDLKIFASDISPAALETARKNAKKHKADHRIRFASGDLFEPFENERFDIVVSNPPYIARRDIAGLMLEVRDFEPPIALYEGAGDDGLAIYRRLIPECAAHLNSGGRFAVEVGLGQARDIEAIAEKAGFLEIEFRLDGAGIQRVVTAIAP